MKPLQVYKPSAMHTVVYVVAIIVTLAALLLLTFATQSSQLKMSEEGKPLLVKSFFILGALLILFSLIFINHIKKKKFILFEQGIQVNNDKLIPFEKIENVYLFLSGKMIGNSYNNLAFQLSENQPWYIIAANYSGKIDEFLKYYTAKRIEYVETKLKEGEAQKFLFLVEKNMNAFGMSAASFVKNLKTVAVILKEDSIIINNQSYRYQNLEPLHLNKERFEIKTRNDETILRFRYVDVMSFDVFREIFDKRTARIGRLKIA